MQLPSEDQFLLTRAELTDRLCGLLGGRAVEELVFGEVTTGAQNDLERATALARQMVAVYGMSERVGLVSCVQRQSAFLPGFDGAMQRDCSEETAREIDEEVKAMLDEAYTKTKDILTAHRDRARKIRWRTAQKRNPRRGPSFTTFWAKKCRARKNQCHRGRSRRW